jgi:hypothetical protein
MGTSRRPHRHHADRCEGVLAPGKRLQARQPIRSANRGAFHTCGEPRS